MPTLAQLRTAVDARLATLWPVTVDRQAQYLEVRGRYWQGIVTCDLAALPDNQDPNGAQVVPADLSRHPTDVAESWADLGISPGAATPFAIKVDAYGGVRGQGFVATVFVRHAGRIFARSRGVGPEERDEPWRVVDVGALRFGEPANPGGRQ